MSGVLASVDQRTQLAGRNRLELLMFRLGGNQLYGINVFKVREVLPCPKLSVIPQSHEVVLGIANIRGRTISVIDLGRAIGVSRIDDLDAAFLIIAEYNQCVQGFLVHDVDRIVNLNWKDIHIPPSGTGGGASYLTAVTRVDEQMVEVIDVERVLAEVVGTQMHVSAELKALLEKPPEGRKLVLVADDSAVARKQICRVLEEDMGLDTVTEKNGRLALDRLRRWADEGHPDLERLALVISDIEMPEMDGYSFTTELRADARLAHLVVILHTSMSGVFNQSMVEQVGADRFIAKFEPDVLAREIAAVIREQQAG